MTRLLKQIMVAILVAGVLLRLVNIVAVNAAPDQYTFSANNNNSVNRETHLDDTPDDPNLPNHSPYYQVPLALTPNDHFLLTHPITNENITWTTSDYRYGYLIKTENIVHMGLDIPAFEQTPVLAAGEGKVVFSGYGLLYGEGAKNDPYGIAVMLRHDDEYDGYVLYTVYTHLDQSLVKVNDKVNAGQKIGGVGMTGNTSGPHLHFEVRIKDERGMLPQNPELWLVPPLEHGVLAGRITNNLGYLLNNWTIRLTSLDTGREWQIKTYDRKVIENHQNDPYYEENFVFNDLPAGRYELFTYYNYVAYKYVFEIVPGAVNYIDFLGKQGFQKGIPPGSKNTDFLN